MAFTMTEVQETITHQHHSIQHKASRSLKTLLALISIDDFELDIDPFVFNHAMVYKSLRDKRFRAVLMFTAMDSDSFALREFNIYDDHDGHKIISHCNFDVKEVYRTPGVEEFYCINTFLNSLVNSDGFRLLTDEEVEERTRQLNMPTTEELEEYQVVRPLINVIVKGGVVQAVYSSIKEPAISVIDLDTITVSEEEITLQVQDQYKVY